jgi:hypothetical protein
MEKTNEKTVVLGPKWPNNSEAGYPPPRPDNQVFKREENSTARGHMSSHTADAPSPTQNRNQNQFHFGKLAAALS